MDTTLIVTHGRSGSTLLQGILNSIEHWQIKGENNNFAFPLFESYLSVQETATRAKGRTTTPTHPWFTSETWNSVEYQQKLAEVLRSMIQTGVDASVTTTGFKEIRYLDILKKDPSGDLLTEYLAFLRQCLSPCKLVFLTRNPTDVLKSGWWKKSDKEKSLQILTQFGEFSRKYSESSPEHAHHITYEEMVSKSGDLAELFTFLGATPSAESLQQCMTTAHSYQTKRFKKLSIPKNAGGHSRPLSLQEADRLHAIGCYDDAKEQYSQVVNDFEAGKINKLPHYVFSRANRQAHVVHASHEHKIAYVPLPKCGCTSLGHLMHEIMYNKSLDPSKNIHDFFWGKRKIVLSLDEYDNYFKFVVVRDPIKRFVSGFRNRILYHNDMGLPVNPNNGLPKGIDINWFALNIEQAVKEYMRIGEHFEPQFQRLGSDLSRYDRITPLEKVESLVDELSTKVGRQLTLGRFQTGGPSYSTNDLSVEALENLLRFYGVDYDLLSEFYQPDQYLQEPEQAA